MDANYSLGGDACRLMFRGFRPATTLTHFLRYREAWHSDPKGGVFYLINIDAQGLQPRVLGSEMRSEAHGALLSEMSTNQTLMQYTRRRNHRVAHNFSILHAQ